MPDPVRAQAPAGLFPYLLEQPGYRGGCGAPVQVTEMKRRLRAARGIKTITGLRIVAAGHAFVQNLRRGHYEIAPNEPPGRRLAVVFAELAKAI